MVVVLLGSFRELFIPRDVSSSTEYEEGDLSLITFGNKRSILISPSTRK